MLIGGGRGAGSACRKFRSVAHATHQNFTVASMPYVRGVPRLR